MINKQNLWFSFLFSIILVLSIFYISVDSDKISDFKIDETETEETSLTISDETELVSLRVQDEEDELETIKELQDILLSDEASLSDKSSAYDELLMISTNKSLEEKIVKIINEEFSISSYVKINGDNVTVVVKSEKNDYSIANQIIRKVNEQFSDEKYITVKFS